MNNLPAMQVVWVQSLGGKDPLEKEMATTLVSLPGEIPWTEEPGGLQSIWSQRVRHNLATKPSTSGHPGLEIKMLYYCTLHSEK